MSNIPISVTVRHIDEPTSKYQSVIQDEVGKLENYFNSVVSFAVVVEGISKISNGVELRRKVDITAVAKGSTLVASAEEERFGKALDSAIAKIKIQLSKLHEKISDNHKKSVPTADVVN